MSPPDKRTHTAHTARIVEWDQKKGFGFLQHGKRRLFLHWRDFAVKHRRPVVGDEVRFVVGQDAKGRRCAKEAVQLTEQVRISPLTWAVLIALLILPTLALHRHGINLLWSAGYLLVIGAFTYWRYAVDKKLAKTTEWRIPEAQLQALDILGGWPGGFLAQRRLRHKCSKGPYQFMFWLVVAVYQVIAIDALLDWKIIRSMF